jgi:hypothetical protein
MDKEQAPKEAMGKLEQVHGLIEARGDMQYLPWDIDRVMPTALGNAFAVMEEYPYYRYGMDAMLFWPRLSAVIPAEYRTDIANVKTALDFLLNLSLLALIFGLEVLGISAWHLSYPEAIYGLSALVIAFLLYRSAIISARSLGELVTSSFDLFRDALLEQLGIAKLAGPTEERQVWLNLASFIRRGEEFYFPDWTSANTRK